jgi:hypothetical protein
MVSDTAVPSSYAGSWFSYTSTASIERLATKRRRSA